MREMGVDVKYSNIRQSYYYADGCRIKIKLEAPESKALESEKIKLPSESLIL
jgi:hypothetical protein